MRCLMTGMVLFILVLCGCITGTTKPEPQQPGPDSLFMGTDPISPDGGLVFPDGVSPQPDTQTPESDSFSSSDAEEDGTQAAPDSGPVSDSGSASADSSVDCTPTTPELDGDGLPPQFFVCQPTFVGMQGNGSTFSLHWKGVCGAQEGTVDLTDFTASGGGSSQPVICYSKLINAVGAGGTIDLTWGSEDCGIASNSITLSGATASGGGPPAGTSYCKFKLFGIFGANDKLRLRWLSSTCGKKDTFITFSGVTCP